MGAGDSGKVLVTGKDSSRRLKKFAKEVWSKTWTKKKDGSREEITEK